MAGQVLALFLDGPLQSWGYQSKFDRRTSLSYPTRSGIVGILCAALGVDRSDAVTLRKLDKALSITVYTFGLPSMTVDYHTVGGGYQPERQPQNIVPKADGSAGKTVVTYREYLQEARFGVLVSADRTLLGALSTALQDPKWGVWLGRKSCIPASPLFQGLFPSEQEALAHLERLAGAPHTRKVVEVQRFDEGTDTLLDRPLDFAARRFKPRRVDA